MCCHYTPYYSLINLLDVTHINNNDANFDKYSILIYKYIKGMFVTFPLQQTCCLGIKC